MNKIYTLDRFIREYDKDNDVKKAITNCITKNMTKEVAIDILSNDLQKRLYDFVCDSEELNIDDGSNVERVFTEAIKSILTEYFQG